MRENQRTKGHLEQVDIGEERGSEIVGHLSEPIDGVGGEWLLTAGAPEVGLIDGEEIVGAP